MIRRILIALTLLMSVGCATATGQVRFPPRTVTTTPTWGIYANPAASGSIHTILDYFLDDPGHATAQARALSAGSTHCFELFDYGAAEDTVGHFPLDAYFARVVSNCTGGTAIWLSVAPVGTDGLRHVPAGLEATAWDDPAMIAAYNGFVDHLFTITGNQLKLLSVGNEIDGYFGLHPSEIAAYATFLRAVRSHAHTLFGGQFQVATTWTYTGAYAHWPDYAAVAAAIDVKAFTYYFFGITGTDDISTEFQRAALMASGPYIYQEIGFPSSPTFGLTLADQNNIITYAQALLNAFAAQRQLIGATWFQLSDYNEDVLTNAGYTTPLLQYFATGGLRDTSNAAKPSFTTLCTAFGGTTCTDAVTPTAPATPNTPSPANSATAVSITPTLTFACSGETSTTIDFGTNTPPSNIVSGHSLGALTSYTPASLTASTQYYWKVHCTNATGTTDGPIWTFTTYSASAPAAPNTPSPANSATGVSINPTLSFACAGETSTTIDFGTDSPPTNIKSNFSLGALTAFTPATLINSTTYHWKVHCTNSTGTTNGSEWAFTTAAPTVHIAPISAPACADPADDSVTGRNPGVMTCAQTHALHLAYADYLAHPTLNGPTTPAGKWMERVVHACTDFSDPYSCAIVYQMTGNTTYVALATATFAQDASTGSPDIQGWYWGCLGWFAGTSPCNPPPGGNGHCHFSTNPCGLRMMSFGVPDMQVMFDLFYSGWSTANQDKMSAYINDYLTDWALHEDMRVNDTDTGLLGPYFAEMTWYELTKDTNPAIVNAVTNYVCPLVAFGCTGLGGLDASGVAKDRTTLRNAISDIVTRFGAGGMWAVSPEYNTTDMYMMIAGYDAIKHILAARGDASDHFPEITTYIQDALLLEHYEITPDHLQTVGWGDIELRRTMMVPRYYAHDLGAELGADPSGTNAQLGQDVLLDLADATAYVNSNPLNQSQLAQCEARCLFWYPGTAVSRGDRSTLPKGKYMAGMGFTFYHDGIGTNDSLFSVQFPHTKYHCSACGRWEATDHTPQGPFGDIQLYRQGDWALTHPEAYQSYPTGTGWANNAWSTYNRTGIPAGEYARTLAHEIGASPDFVYQMGTNGGEAGNEEESALGSYLHEATRSVVYLPSTDKQSDTIVTFDRFNNDDHNGVTPRRLVSFHMPVSPTVTSATRLTWTADNGDHAQLDTLLPTSTTRTAVSEAALYNDTEGKYRIDISDASGEPQFDTFLNVFTADDGIVHSAGLISSGDGAVGPILHRASLNDVALIFNGRVGGTQTPGPSVDNAGRAHWNETVVDVLDHVHFFRAGYSLTFSTITSTANVLLFDLDPTLSWTKSIDGAGASALTVDAQGVANFTLSGAASHTIVIGGGTTEQQIQPLGLSSKASNLSVGPSTSVSASYTASGTNTYLTVGGWIANSVDKTAGCIANGVAMTLIGKQLVNSDIWEYAYGIAAPAAGTHTWTCTFTDAEPADFVSQVYTGVKQVNTPDHLTLTLGSSPTGENFSFSNTATVKNAWHVAVVRASVIPSSEYSNARTIHAATYPSGGVSMFDSGGPVSTIRSFTMTTLQGGGFNSSYGAIMFSLAPAP